MHSKLHNTTCMHVMWAWAHLGCQSYIPLMYWFELQDITFLLKCLQDPNDHMNIFQYVTFASSITRAGNAGKLKSNHCKTSTVRHFFFNRVVRLWNSLPNNLIDLSQSVQTNIEFLITCGVTLTLILTRLTIVHFMLFAHAPDVTHND